MRALLLATTCLATAAFAQATPFQGSQRLLLSSGTLRGSPRMMGLGGAYVGIAEGAEGMTRNAASIVSKDAHFDGDSSLDFGGTMHFLMPGSVKEQDWDNDGRPEQREGPLANLGTQVFYSVVAFRYKNFGIGGGFDLQNFLAATRKDGETFDRVLNVGLLHFFGALGYSFWNDQILVGAGVETTHALFGYGEKPDGQLLPGFNDSAGYHGWGLQLGALWRPENENYRIGFAFSPNTTAWQAGNKAQIGGWTLPSQVVSPGRVSLGGSFAFGEGRAYNITSREGWMLGADGQPGRTAAMTKWLVTAQLDVTLPVDNAVAMSPFLEQPLTDAIPAGDRPTFCLRAAVEKEVFIDRLRLRLGGYLEPPTTATGPILRPHLNFGFEIFLFKVKTTRMSFGLSFDFARLYQNLSFAVLVWK